MVVMEECFGSFKYVLHGYNYVFEGISHCNMTGLLNTREKPMNRILKGLHPSKSVQKRKRKEKTS